MIADPQPGRVSWWSSWLALAAACLFTALLLNTFSSVREFSNRMNDGLFRVRNQFSTQSNIIVIAIDDDSLAQYGRWPWPRTLLAHLIAAVSAQQPKAIGVDILLSEPSDTKSDSLLAQAIRRAGNVTLAAKLSNSAAGPLWIEPLPSFAQEAAGVGHVQAILDEDGVCRRLPFTEMTLRGPIPMLSTLLVSEKNGNERSGQRPSVLTLRPSERIIDYRGLDAGAADNKPFRTISAASILNGEGHNLSNRIVLIGFAGSGLEDELLSPLDYHAPAPGVLIQANMSDTLDRARTIRPVPLVYQILILGIVCVVGSLATRAHAALRTLAWICGSVVILCAIAFAVFALWGLQFQLGLDLVAAVLIVPLAQLQHLMTLQELIGRRLVDLQLRATSIPLAVAGVIRPQEPVSASRTPTKAEGKLKLVSALEGQISLISIFQHSLLQSMRDGIAVFTTDGHLIFHNPAWAGFLDECRWTDHSCWSNVLAALRTPLDVPHAMAEIVDGNAPIPERAAKEVLIGEHLWHLSLLKLPTSMWSEVVLYMAISADLTAQMDRDQARQQALQFITHELHTPLVSLQGFAELLQRFPQQAQEAGAAGIIQQESERLVALTSMYLECLRLETTLPVISPVAIEAGSLLKRAALLAEPLCTASNKRFVLSTPDDRTPLNVDIAMLTSALLNLIANALKYGEKDAAVYGKVETSLDGACLSISNAGPPIPAEEVSRIFAPQYRMPQHMPNRSGWGIGLAFVKRVMEAHAGTVRVSSDSRETCFQLLLPISHPPGENRR